MSAGGQGPQQFNVNIICVKCGNLGVVAWENHRGERSLISVSHGFHERLSKKAPYLIELVCNECHTSQPEL